MMSCERYDIAPGGSTVLEEHMHVCVHVLYQQKSADVLSLETFRS